MTMSKLRHAFSPRRNRAALRRLVRGVVGDRRGVAAVEFAMILPALLAIYFGVVEVAQGVMADRKVTQLNRALADLTAQSVTLGTTDVTNIFDAALSVMTPYSPSRARMMIASVVIDAGGIARVCWSDQRNSTALSRGATVTLPADLRVPNSSLIMARASYDFEPVVGYLITGTIRIGDTPIYMRPRAGKTGGTGNVEQVEKTGTAMCPGF
jgi:Flp pilus assembly protein TadG